MEVGRVKVLSPIDRQGQFCFVEDDGLDTLGQFPFPIRACNQARAAFVARSAGVNIGELKHVVIHQLHVEITILRDPGEVQDDWFRAEVQPHPWNRGYRNSEFVWLNQPAYRHGGAIG
jgi:hypothetical protein